MASVKDIILVQRVRPQGFDSQPGAGHTLQGENHDLNGPGDFKIRSVKRTWKAWVPSMSTG
jgi:hypothetical protein